ncbi:ubiquitin-specific protease doa4 [Allomyces javanicus]|nr:ubiquitin-specific protease doa4 [Allomyces javanicus]
MPGPIAPPSTDPAALDAAVSEYITKLSADIRAMTVPARPSALVVAKKLLSDAVACDEQRDYASAFRHYLQFATIVIEVLPKVALTADMQREYKFLHARIPKVLDRSETLRDTLMRAKRHELIAAANAAAAARNAAAPVSTPPAALATPKPIHPPARSSSYRTPPPTTVSTPLSASPRAGQLSLAPLTSLPPARKSSMSPGTAHVSPTSPAPYALGPPADAPNGVHIRRPAPANGAGVPARTVSLEQITNGTGNGYHRSVHDVIQASMANNGVATPRSMATLDDDARRRQRALRTQSILDPRAWGGQYLSSLSADPDPNGPTTTTWLPPTAPGDLPVMIPPALPPRKPVPPSPLSGDMAILGSAGPRGSMVAGSPHRALRRVSTGLPPRSTSALSSPATPGMGMAALSRTFTETRFHASASAFSEVDAHGVCGLKNMGNSCYQNSILQCLNGTVPLMRYFASGAFKAHLNPKNPLGTGGQLSVAFFNLVQDMSRSSGTFVAPVQFRDVLANCAPQFASYDQQDSQEFLAYMLDTLHEDLKRPPPPGTPLPPSDNDDLESLDAATGAHIAWDRYLVKNSSFLVELFQGQVRSQLRCLTCGKMSVTYAPFMTMALPLPSGSPRDVFSLEQCLHEYLRTEILEGDDAWRCPQCQAFVAAEKSTQVTRWPEVLLLSLKRFSYVGPFRNKVGNLVQFPVRSLNLNAYVGLPSQADTFVYDLYGVSNHFGGMDGGHYTAIVNHGNAWHYFDDSRVSKCDDERDIVTPAAYNLFYVRRQGLTGASASNTGGASKL